MEGTTGTKGQVRFAVGKERPERQSRVPLSLPFDALLSLSLSDSVTLNTLTVAVLQPQADYPQLEFGGHHEPTQTKLSGLLASSNL